MSEGVEGERRRLFLLFLPLKVCFYLRLIWKELIQFKVIVFLKCFGLLDVPLFGFWKEIRIFLLRNRKSVKINTPI